MFTPLPQRQSYSWIIEKTIFEHYIFACLQSYISKQFWFRPTRYPPSLTLFWTRKQQTGRQIHLQSSAECDMTLSVYHGVRKKKSRMIRSSHHDLQTKLTDQRHARALGAMVPRHYLIKQDILQPLGCIWVYQYIIYLIYIYITILYIYIHNYITKIITYYKNYSKKRFQKNCSPPRYFQGKINDCDCLALRAACTTQQLSGFEPPRPGKVRVQSRGAAETGCKSTTSLKPSMQVVLQKTLEVEKIERFFKKLGEWNPAFCWRTCFLYYWMAFKKTVFQKSSTWNLHQKEYQVESQPWMNRTLQRW